jgi:hypothetical protein
MNGAKVKEYLGFVCESMDRGRSLEPLRQVMVRYFLKPLALPAALGLSMAVGLAGGCNEEETNCTDGVDNDGDGTIDCSDSDCYDTVACNTADAYGVPFEENCSDNLDNDGDGTIDCDDSDCNDDSLCAADLYAAPFI